MTLNAARFIRLLAWPAAVGTTAAALLVALSPWWTIADLAVHWSVHVAVISVFPLVVWRSHRLGGWLLTAVFLVLCAPGVLAAFQTRAAQVQPDDHTIVLTTVNLYVHNAQPAAAVPIIAASQSDVVILIECDAADEASLRDDPRWPYQQWEHDRPWGGFGMGVISALPFISYTAVVLDNDIFIDCTIEKNGAPLRILAVHPRCPVSTASIKIRDSQLVSISALSAASSVPTVAAGDWNCTPLSPAWWRTLSLAGWQRPAASAGATWPSPLGPLGIAIDHIIVRSGAHVDRPCIEWIAGSDHQALTARIGWPK